MTSTAEPARRLHPDEGTSPGHVARTRQLAHSAAAVATRRPMVTVVSVALFVRLAAALVLWSRGGYTIPDEGQYVELARYVASGRGADAWAHGYGQSLYDSTYAFSGLLTDLFRILGPHRILGQLIATAFGAVTAGVAAWLARRVVTSGWALAAGLLVALVPSQVLWSSVVLRESMVWAAAGAVAVATTIAARGRSARQLGAAGLIGGAGLIALGFLREQTAFIAVWALLIAICTFSITRPVVVRLGAFVLALGLTLSPGSGRCATGWWRRRHPP